MTKSGITSLILIALLFSFMGCKKTTGTNKTATSTHNSTSSKNMSGVCQNCHTSGTSTSGWWTVAGAVYTKDFSSVSPNGTLYFYSQPNGQGTLRATLEVDGKGLFYTSNVLPIFPPDTSYVQIVGAFGDIQNMVQFVTSGNCNSCHGVTRQKIWVN